MTPSMPFPSLRAQPARQRLLQAVLEVSGELGYEQVAVRHVIERAKGSRATFYKNFDDLQDCFTQAHRDASEWLYQRLMLITIGVGIAGASVTFALFRGGPNVYRNALIVLVVGTVLGELHTRASLELRGKMVPANVKFYINLFTLILFVILGLPSVRNRITFARPRGKIEAAAAGGMAAFIVGAMMLGMPMMLGDTHTFEGTDWTEVLQPWMSIAGVAFAAGGLGVFLKAVLEIVRRPEPAGAHQPVTS